MRKTYSNQYNIKMIITIVILNFTYIITLFYWKDIVICPDEMGYWTLGAWINHIDWSDVMSYSPYYGWGYGLLLSCLFSLHDPVKMYWGAELINLLLLNITFLLLVKICYKLHLATKEGNVLFIVPALILIYPSNILYVHTCLSEILILCLYTLSIVLLIYFLEKPSVFKLFLLEIVVVYSISVHYRSFVIAGVLTLLLFGMCIEKKIPVKYLIFWSVILFVGIQGVLAVKGKLIEAEYIKIGVDYNETNDNLMGWIVLIKEVFQKKTIQSIFAKFFYGFCASFGMLYLGIYCVFKKCIEIKSEEKYIWYFLEMSSMSMIVLTGIITINNERLDAALYGRYFENYIQILILIGMMSLANKIKITYQHGLLIYLAFAIIFLLSRELIMSKNELDILEVQISGVSGYFGGNHFSKRVFYTDYIFVFASMMVAVLFILYKMNKAKMIYGILAILWLSIGYRCWNGNICKDSVRFDAVREAAKTIKQYDEYQFWYLVDEGARWTSYYDMYNLQFDMQETSLHTITLNEIDSLDVDDILVVHKVHPYSTQLINDRGVLWENDRICLLINPLE